MAEHEAAAERSLGLCKERLIAELQTAIELAREQGNPAAQIAGWREIGKMCGYYAPERRQIVVTKADDAMQARLEAMSDAELLEIAVGR